MNISERIIVEARERGARHFFGIPGGGCPLELIEYGRRHGVEFVNVAHESSAAIVAGYYGLLKQTAGLALTIRGVGGANLVGGMVNAMFERLPVVAVCETVSESLRDYPVVQNLPQRELFSGFAKYAAILRADDAACTIADAFDTAADGRPGPALIELPGDVASTEAGGIPPSQCQKRRPASPDGLSLFLDGLRKPAILAGADVVRAGAEGELLRLAEAVGAAVMVTMDARGAFPESHPRWAGVFEGMFNPNIIESKVLGAADGLLVAGADAIMKHSPWKPVLPVCELSLRHEYPLFVPTAMRICGDLKQLLSEAAALPRPGFAEDEIRTLWDAILPFFARPEGARFTAQDIISITRRVLPDGGMLFSETGAFVVMLETLYRVERPGTYYGTAGGRTMGLTLPAMIGARLARPDVPMVGIGGDGSTLMRLGELETAARCGVAFPLIIINDGALGTIKSRQRSRGLPDHALDLHPVDFAGIARACGLCGVRVDTPESFESALRSALTAPTVTVIDSRVDAAAYQKSFGPTIGVLD